MAKCKQGYKPLDLGNIARRTHKGEEILPPPPVLDHIVSVISHIDYHIEAGDCEKSWPILQKAFGLNLWIHGGPLFDALCHLAREGRIAAYHMDGGTSAEDIDDLCFCGRRKFERWCEETPELRQRQELFLSPQAEQAAENSGGSWSEGLHHSPEDPQADAVHEHLDHSESALEE